jgi:hypothetical protein
MKRIEVIREMVRAGSLALFMLGGLSSCAGMQPVQDGKAVYHCVDRSIDIAAVAARARPVPLEVFEYGSYRIENRPTISAGGICITQPVPRTAYLRYRLDERIVEKTLDLSALNARRVRDRTVEFHVDGAEVEVRLLTRVPGNFPVREVILRQ